MMSATENSFHTDTRDTIEDTLLFHRSHHGFVDDEELSPKVSPFSAGVGFMNALTHLLFFFGSTFKMGKKNLLPYNLFILLSPQPGSNIHVIMVIYK